MLRSSWERKDELLSRIEGKSHDDELRMRDCRPVCQAEGGELMEKVANGTFHVTFFTNVLPASVHFRGRAEVGWNFPHRL